MISYIFYGMWCPVLLANPNIGDVHSFGVHPVGTITTFETPQNIISIYIS